MSDLVCQAWLCYNDEIAWIYWVVLGAVILSFVLTTIRIMKEQEQKRREQ